jgi:hypothetical protein
MTVLRVVAGLSCCMLIGACDIMSPTERGLARITNIDTPAQLTLADTLRIRFRYEFGGCQSFDRIVVERVENGLAFSVVVRQPAPTRRQLHCPAVQTFSFYSHTVPPSERTSPFRLTFRQPSGSDDFRVIRKP